MFRPALTSTLVMVVGALYCQAEDAGGKKPTTATEWLENMKVNESREPTNAREWLEQLQNDRSDVQSTPIRNRR